jgi:integrase
MGLHKICEHKGRTRDRCEHAWWGSFRGVRVSLTKWTNREIRTKAKAAAALDELRVAIRGGTFDERGRQTRAITPLTFREFAAVYKERHALASGMATGRTIDWRLHPLLDRFGDRPLAGMTTADVEAFAADLKKPRMKFGRESVLAASSINRTIELLRHMMNWAVNHEYLDRTPFRRGAVTLIKKLREDHHRRRRISEDEEARILAAAPPPIRPMIICALDTGMRRGEMLALRFGDVDLKRGLIVLRGVTTKSRKTRVVPIPTARLRAALEWLRLDAVGEQKSDDTLVFSDGTGEALPLFHATWLVTVLRAHGVRPRWSRKNEYKGLTRESQEAFQKINLHWHDLRHEYASRLVEQGVPLAQVRDLLGHASITTTERYDNQKLENLQAAAAKLERGLVFDAAPLPRAQAPASPPPDSIDLKASTTGAHQIGGAGARRPPNARPASDERASARKRAEGWRKFQDSFKSEKKHRGPDTPKEVPAIEPNELKDLSLKKWLGRRDSNPNNLLQRQVSYR